ncbi:MAG: serine/threonine-protein kinase [Planctomycetota bacterium]
MLLGCLSWLGFRGGEKQMIGELNRQAELIRHLIDAQARAEALAWRSSRADDNDQPDSGATMRFQRDTPQTRRDKRPIAGDTPFLSERQEKRFWDRLQRQRWAIAWSADPVSSSGSSAGDLWLAAALDEPLVQQADIRKIPAAEFLRDALPTGTTGGALRVDLLDAQGHWMASLPPGDRPAQWRSSAIVPQLIRGGSGAQARGGLARDAAVEDADQAIAWRWSPAGNYGLTVRSPRSPWVKTGLYLAAAAVLAAGLGLLALAISLWQSRRRRRIATASSAAAENEGPPARLGDYNLGEKLGEGGMGDVYRATHRALNRDVAIKLLRRASDHPTAVKRFEREVQLTARLRHPNTIAIYDFGRTDYGAFYYVMEYINGLTLQSLVDRFGPQEPGRVVHLMLQICGSLAEAHGQGLIHRDIKPANILVSNGVGTGDLVKVLDFGLIKELQPNIEADPLLTRNDSITGTPMYMSPEAVRDAASANTQSDLYSAAAVGYTLLAGMPMFEVGSSVEVCVRQMNEVPMRPSKRLGQSLPRDLEDVLMTALEKDPGKRWMSVDDFAAALRRCQIAGSWSSGDAEIWWSAAEATIRDPQSAVELTAPDPTVVNQ